MGRAKQGGSILGYVLVGGVLILLLLGGAYVFRTYFSGAPQAAKQPAATAPAPSNTDSKKDEGKTDSKASDDTAKTAPATPKPAPAAPQSPSTATQLPQTGPVDTFMAILALGALTASLGVYLQSRRITSFDL